MKKLVLPFLFVSAFALSQNQMPETISPKKTEKNSMSFDKEKAAELLNSNVARQFIPMPTVKPDSLQTYLLLVARPDPSKSVKIPNYFPQVESLNNKKILKTEKP